MTDLAEWLLAAIADDEQVARSATAGPWWAVPDRKDSIERRPLLVRTGDDADDAEHTFGREIVGSASEWIDEAVPNAAHIARWAPKRVLDECDAKRRIIARHSRTYTGDNGYQWCRRDDDHVPCWDLRDLAAPYAHRPGYLNEWRPKPLTHTPRTPVPNPSHVPGFATP